MNLESDAASMAEERIESAEELFKDGTFIHPVESEWISSVHLMRGMRDAKTKKALEMLGDVDHVVFVLLDALGMHLVNQLPNDNILKKHLVTPMTAVSPSTTACALTSIATAEFPGEHAIFGWNAYLAEKDTQTLILPFLERFSKKTLTIPVEEVFSYPSWITNATNSLVVNKMEYVDTVYSKYMSSGTCAGYRSFQEVEGIITNHVKKYYHEKTFTYCYCPEPDSMQHTKGVTHAAVMPTCESLSQTIEALTVSLSKLHDAKENTKKIKIVVTADHGHIDIDFSKSVCLPEGDELFKFLKTKPHTDPRIPFFAVKDGMYELFEDYFARKYPHWKLISIAKAEELKLFSDKPQLSALSKLRASDYIAVSITKGIFCLLGEKVDSFVGMHGGLLKDEMLIPLVIIPA